MPYNLDDIIREAKATSLHSPFPLDVAVAVVNDCFRRAGKAPVIDKSWARWQDELGSKWPEQIGMAAHLLTATSLGDVTVEALRQAKLDRRSALRQFFDFVEPLTAEMIRSNTFRREEFLRRWLQWCEAAISGEQVHESLRRLGDLDYRRTVEEYEKTEELRKEEVEARLQRAQKQKTAARGWRE